LQGADPWIQDHCGGRTALHYVALRAGADTAQALLQEVAPSAMITRMGTRMVT
jgi:ankyrin repeat protein